MTVTIYPLLYFVISRLICVDCVYANFLASTLVIHIYYCVYHTLLFG